MFVKVPKMPEPKYRTYEKPWEILHPEVPFVILTKTPGRTIEKLLARYPELAMWVNPPGSFFYYKIDVEVMKKLKQGEEADTIYTTNPGLPGAAIGKARLSPSDFFL